MNEADLGMDLAEADLGGGKFVEGPIYGGRPDVGRAVMRSFS